MLKITGAGGCRESKFKRVFRVFQATLKRNLEVLYEKFMEKKSVLLPHNPGYEVSGLEINVSTLIEIFGYKCRLPINFANSLDPDQARQNVGPDVDRICLTL